MPKALSNRQLRKISDKFRREGYVVIPGALSEQEMRPIIEQWQRLRSPLRNGEHIEGVRRENFFIHGKLPAPVGSVVHHPNITSIAKQLIGPDVALYLNRLNVKDQAFTDSIHMHQDMPYFNGGVNKVNFFLALQETSEKNGAMAFVPRSHHLGFVSRDTIDISKYPKLGIVVPHLQPGDLLIADIRLWHSSVPNAETSDRVLLQMMFQPANDGSYYPLSVPEPCLITGEWKTDIFTPWEQKNINANDNITYPASDSPQIMKAYRDIIGKWPNLSLELLSQRLNRYALEQKLKTMLSLKTKQRIRKCLDFFSGKKPAGLAHWSGAVASASSAIPARTLPAIFTPSTGPQQVWPLKEEYIDWPKELAHTAAYLKKSGKTNILLACRKPVSDAIIKAARANGLTLKGYVHVLYPGEDNFSRNDGLPIYTPEDLKEVKDVDAVVVLATLEFSIVIRRCEQFLRPDILFVPAAREALAPEPVRVASSADWTERSSILSYLYTSGLRGHFAEFGTFFGRAFFPSYYELHHWLQGKFFAFDSFEGLSQPDPRETRYTNGDFIKGAYGFNHASFRALAEILGLPQERIVTVPGFFDQSLTPQKAAELGIAPKSISVCRIDCDLLEPTLSVLEFIAPLLDDGALVYFDDWRLCRADPNIGERGAALRWLKANPSFELVDFPSIHWQHQWFIFHRNKQV